MTDLILTGSSGSGKTVVGRLLGERFGLEFVDTDAEIERRAGCTIAELWAAREEPAFRDLEHQIFRELLGSPGDRVISTGAGLLVQDRNRAELPPGARVVSLACDVDELVARLLPKQAARPLLAGLDREHLVTSVQERLERRKRFYDRYEIVDTSKRSIEEVAADIAARTGLSQAASLIFSEQHECQVLFGRGLLSSLGETVAGGEVMLITDEVTRALPWFATAVRALRSAGCQIHEARIPAGERYKTLNTVAALYDRCLQARLDRSATVVGVGGGVVGDIAGFIAATYLRGLSLVLVPTTLLAQVDAAIGGKVGVDLQGAKNMVGAFHPARAVIIDPDVLTTLPRGLLGAGLAEIVKIAWMRSTCLLHSVETLTGVDDIVSRLCILRRAAGEKARLVNEDPYEQGDRALLNFGHTVGHGLEAASGYALVHGHAVSVGMVAEARLAEERGWCEPGTLQRLASTLRRLELPTSAPGFDAAVVFDFVAQDKKRRAGKLRLAVPQSPGKGIVVEVEESDGRQAIEYALEGEM